MASVICIRLQLSFLRSFSIFPVILNRSVLGISTGSFTVLSSAIRCSSFVQCFFSSVVFVISCFFVPCFVQVVSSIRTFFFAIHVHCLLFIITLSC